ncbi:MAG: DUF4150 domain-containing protein, partial [Planctomycetaceae bacterium]
TIHADGGNMCAKYGSEFFKSTGDEAGVGGGVKSGTFIKEATWITYSFDVKLEGKGACRLTDKMFHNHQNTVNAAGLLQKILELMKTNLEKGCAALLEHIKNLIGEGVTGKVNGIRGLAERFSQQIFGGGLGSAGAPNAPFDRGPNPQLGFSKGSNSWMRHNKEISTQQNNLKKSLDEYDDKCKGGPPPPANAREWANKPLPQPADWKGPQWVAPRTQSSGWGSKLLKGTLIVGAGILAVGTVAAAIIPFDGPFGEAALGTGTAAAWSAAMAIP